MSDRPGPFKRVKLRDGREADIRELTPEEALENEQAYREAVAKMPLAPCIYEPIIASDCRPDLEVSAGRVFREQLHGLIDRIIEADPELQSDWSVVVDVSTFRRDGDETDFKPIDTYRNAFVFTRGGLPERTVTTDDEHLNSDCQTDESNLDPGDDSNYPDSA